MKALLELAMSGPRVVALVFAVSICGQLSVATTLKRLKKMPVEKMPVDVVYTWMPQPSKDQFEAILRDCPDLHQGWARVRDFDQLRFSLRLLEQNIPWVRRVFLVTADGSAPSWLNASFVKVINQEDLIPETHKQRVLPIHNSQQIEVYLHRIPGLAEHFVYFNDDMFVGRPLQRTFFFTDSGKPVMYTKPGECAFPEPGWRDRDEPGHLQGQHTPYPVTKSMITEMQRIWPETFKTLAATHCRTSDPSNGPTWLYQWYGAQSGSMELSGDGKFAFLSGEGELISPAKLWYEKQLSDPPQLGCINDNFDTDNEGIFDEQVRQLSAFMDAFSGGRPSQFEKRVQALSATKHSKIQRVFRDQVEVKVERFREVSAWLQEFRRSPPKEPASFVHD